MKLIDALILLSLTSLLHGCGQMGPLYHPDDRISKAIYDPGKTFDSESDGQSKATSESRQTDSESTHTDAEQISPSRSTSLE